MKIKRFVKEIVRSFYVFVVVTLASSLTVPISLWGGDLPSGPNVQVGNPTITTDGNEMTINAGSHNKTWIDWQGGFNIGRQNTVNNIGPSAAAVMLHNDVSGAISSIQGVLNGNCNVFLLNANGILFSPTASVNVGGLVTSTLMMSHEDFLSGNYVFKSGDLQNPGVIVNAGTINALGEGGVTMMGSAVKNLGVINVNLGNVNLISGEEVTLNVTGSGTIQAKVNREILNNVYDQDGNRVNTGVENTGTITADGSTVYMETGAVKDVFDTLINQEGIVKAGSMVERNGKIILVSESEGIVQNTGTLDVSAIEAGADGGTVEITGSKVGQFGTINADAIDGDGGNINLYATDVVALSSDSLTTANAGLNGDGGNVIVYSPETALFWENAQIEAKGGSLSGDGGFVEVSGKQHVEIYGLVDASASNGQVGTFLIDPNNITIQAAAPDANITGATPFQSTSDDAILTTATLIAALGGSNVVVQTMTAAPDTQLGNITVADVIDFNGIGAPRLLTLVAHHDIIVNAAITDSVVGGESLSIVLNAGAEVDINAPIFTYGGILNSFGTAFDNTGGTITTRGGAVDLTGHTGVVTIGAAINTSGAAGGSIDITGSSINLAIASALTTNNANITLNSPVTLIADTTLSTTTAVGGNIIFNDSIDGGHILNLIAGTGNVDLEAGNIDGLTVTSSATTDITGAMVVDGNVNITATGEIDVANTGSLTTTGIGTLTLASTNGPIDINGAVSSAGNLSMTTTSGNVEIDANLETAGDSTLTLASTNNNVEIAQDEDAAVTSVNGKIDINAGASVLLGSDTDTGQIVTIGTGDVEITAATAFTMDDEPGTIVNSGGKITIDPATVTIDASGLLAVGNITVAATDIINVNGVVNSTSGSTGLTVTDTDDDDVATINVAANIIGDDVTITAVDANSTSEQINVTSSLNNNRGGYTFEANDGTLDIDNNIITSDFIALNGGTAINLAANLTAVNNINVNDALTLDGAAATRTIESATGDVTFNSTIDDDVGVNSHSLIVNAASGLVDFKDIVCPNVPRLENLTVAAKNVEFNNNVTVNNNLILTNSENILLATKPTTIILWAISGDILFNPTGQLDGAHGLLVSAGDDVTFGTIGASTPLTSLFAHVDGTFTLNNDITVAGEIDFRGSGGPNDIDLAGDINIISTAGGNIHFDNGTTIDGAYDLAVTNTSGNIFFSAVGQNRALDTLLVNANSGNLTISNTTTSGLVDLDASGNVNITGAIDSINGTVDVNANTNVNVGGDIDGDNVTVQAGTGNVNINAVLDNTRGGYYITAGNGTIDINSNITAADFITLGSPDISIADGLTILATTDLNAIGVISTAGATTLTSSHGNARIGSITGLPAGAIILNATEGDLAMNDITGVASLDVNASTATLNGTTITTAGTINFDDVGTTNLATDVVMTSGGNDIDLGTSFEGSHTLQLVAGAGNVDLEAGNIDGLTVTSSATTDIAGVMVVDGNITVAATDTINVNGVVNSTSGSVGLTVTNIGDAVNNATINVAANLIGDDVTLTASDDSGAVEQINVTSSLNNNRGGYTFEANDGTLDINNNILASDFIALNGAAAINLAANLIAVNNININDALTLDGNSIITSNSGNVAFASTIGDDAGQLRTLTVNSTAGTTTFASTIGADGNRTGAITVAAKTANLGGNIYTDDDSNVSFSNTDTVILTNNVTIDTETGDSADAGDILFKTTGTITGAHNLDLDATVGGVHADGSVVLGSVDTKNLDVDTTGTTTLYGNITADDDVSLDGASDVNLANDVIILGDGSTDVLLNGGDVTGDFDLSVDTGTGAVTLDAIDVNKLVVTSTGITTVNDNLTTDEGMDFANASHVDTATGIILANTDSGTIDLSGGDVDAAGALTINAFNTDVKLGILDVAAAGALDVNSTGTTTIVGDITTVGGSIAFDGATNIVLGADTVISTGAAIGGHIDFVAAGGTNSLSGGFDLQLIAGAGTVSLDNITQLAGLDVTSSNTTQFAGTTDIAGPISVAATTLIDVDGSTTTTGAITFTSANDIDVDANLTTSGGSPITLTADSNTSGAGNLDIAQTSAATITSGTGKITLRGEDINLGNAAGPVIGIVHSTGNGEIKITANYNNTGNNGNFTIAGAGSELNSGGNINVDDPWNVTIGGDGMTAVGDITIGADNDIDINAPVNSTLAGDIKMTASNNILLSDEVRTTSTGDITLTARNGVIDDDDVGTEDEYVACDTLTMTAANGIGITTSDIDTQANTIIANTTGAGAASIAIENINSQTTILGVVAGGVNNTVGTNADFTFQQTGGGGLVVRKVFTTDGGIGIDSVGATAEPGIRVDFATTHAAPNNAGGIDAGGLTNGTVTLNTDGGGMVLGSVLGDNTINIIADIGDIAIDVVGDSSNVDVNITSTSGYIDELVETGVIEDPDVDITGDEVTLSSAIGIGKKYELEIDAVTLNADTSSSSGNVVISELNDVILKNVSTVDGYIDITADGYIVVENISANGIGKDVTLHSTGGLGAGHRDIALNTVLADDDITVTADTGDIYVGTVGDAGTDDITMTATLGSIVELHNNLGTVRPADAAIDVTGDVLTLTAAGDIGRAGELDIETDITTLVADSTGTGDIYLTELDTGSRDGIELRLIHTNNGDITLITNGGKHEPEIETSVIDVRSDTGGANGHSISITAQTGDITLEYVSTDNDTGANGDVTLEATLGSITEIDRRLRPADIDVDVVADLLTMTAYDEIGSTTGELDIETTIASLNASTTHVGTGDIVITETDAIDLVDVDTADGSIIVVAGGQITATDVNSSNTDNDNNDISLTSTGAGIQAIDINAGILGDVTLDAQGGAITQDGLPAVDVTADVLTADAAGGIDLDTAVNTLEANANAAGIVTIDATDAITLANVTTTDGSITVNAGGNMTIGSVTAGGDTGSDDDVFLTTTAGDIIQSGDITALNDTVTLTSARDITDTTDPTTDISAADLILNAPAGNVGAPGINNQLDTDIDTITAAVNGDVYILEKDAVGLTSMVTTAGLVDVEAGGTITATTVTANGGYAVNLNATGGNIFDTPGGLITGTAKSSLKASGIVGTTDNPVDVDIDGDLWVWGGSQQNQVSVILDGTVNSTARTERVEIFEPSPPGLVILNNHLMGGGNYGSGSSEGSILSRGYGETIIAQATVLNLFHARTLQPWGSKISLPSLPSEISIIGDEFLDGPTPVIDGSQIGINVMPIGFSPARFQPENYYIIRTR